MTEFIERKALLEMFEKNNDVFKSQDVRHIIESLPIFHINLEWFTGNDDGKED